MADLTGMGQALINGSGQQPFDPSTWLPNTPNYINPAYATPQQRAQLYAISNELMSPQPVKSGWQGMGEIARALVGGWEGHLADVQEQASQAQDKNDLANTVGAITSPNAAAYPNVPPPAAGASSQPQPQATGGAASLPDPGTVSSYLAQAAAARGIDPKVASIILAGESGGNVSAVGDDGSSFGPVQLHYGGISKQFPNAGLGDAFTAATGLDARDPTTWPKQIDFALDTAKTQGWAPWKTTRDENKLSNYAGIGPNSQAQPVQMADASGSVPIPPQGGPSMPAAPQAPMQMPQGTNGLPVPAAAIGELMGNRNIDPETKVMAIDLLRPQMMTDANGNVRPMYQNQPVTGTPAFQGGVRVPLDLMHPTVPGVLSGPLNAPTYNAVTPNVNGSAPAAPPSGAPGSAAPATPPQAPQSTGPANYMAPGTPLGNLVHNAQAMQARQQGMNNVAGAQSDDYVAAGRQQEAVRNASYPLHQIQGLLEKSGGNIPTGEGADTLMSAESAGNLFSTLLGHPLSAEDSQLNYLQLLHKYGVQVASAQAQGVNVNPTNLGLETAGQTSPGTALSPAANLHLTDNLVRLNDLSNKYLQAKQDFYRQNGNLDGFQQNWQNSVDGGNAVPLSKFPIATRTGKDGQLYDKVPSTDQRGFSWVKHGAVQ